MAKKSILYVEDEDNIAMAFEFFIGKQGYEIKRVSDGDAAVEALAGQIPDLIVLDIMLPKKSGYEVCQIIRGDERFKGVKVLVMTARGGKAEREKSLAIGADAFMTKPFASVDLLSTIESLIGSADG